MDSDAASGGVRSGACKDGEDVMAFGVFGFGVGNADADIATGAAGAGAEASDACGAAGAGAEASDACGAAGAGADMETSGASVVDAGNITGADMETSGGIRRGRLYHHRRGRPCIGDRCPPG